MAADDAAVVVRLSADLKDYEAALKNAVRATERAAQSAEKAISDVGRKSSAGNVIQANFRQSSQQIANDARILQFQLNDIFSGIASGQGIRAVQQQLGQIAQQLSGGSLAAGARTLGSALFGMINPINLAVVAFGLATAAAVEYFSSVDKGSQQSAEALAKVAAEAEKTAKVFASSRFAQSVAQQARAAASEAELLAERQKLVAAATERVADAFANLVPDVARAIDLLQQAGDAEGAEALTTAYSELTAALQTGTGIAEAYQHVLEAARSSTVAMAPDIQTLIGAVEAERAAFLSADQAVQDIDISLAGLRQSHNALNDAVEKGATAAARYTAELDKMKDPAQLLLGIFQQLKGAMQGFSAGGALLQGGIFELPNLYTQAVTATPSASKEFLKTKAASAEIAATLDRLDDDFATALAKLFTVLPSTAKITSGVRSYAEQAKLYADYLSGAGGLAGKPGVGGSLHQFGQAVDIGAGVDMETLREAVKLFPELEQLKGRAYEIDKVHVQMAGTAAQVEKDRVDAAIAGEKKAADAAQQRIETYDRSIQGLENENALLEQQATQLGAVGAAYDQSAVANAAANDALQLEQQLRAQGIELTAAQKTEILGLATANETLKAKMESVKQTQGDATQALKDFNQQMSGVISGAMSGFVQDLIAGEDAGVAFGNMLQRLAGDLADLLLQMLIIKPLMNSLFPTTAGGGILGGLVPIAHGGGSVSALAAGRQRQVSPLAFAGAPRYATGGMVGLKPGEVPIIAHRGEIIVPNARRLASSNAGSIQRSGDVVVGDTTINVNPNAVDAVIATSEQGKLIGKKMQQAVQAVLVMESRPGGILRKTR